MALSQAQRLVASFKNGVATGSLSIKPEKEGKHKRRFDENLVFGLKGRLQRCCIVQQNPLRTWMPQIDWIKAAQNC